jgi:hypothetical protein
VPLEKRLVNRYILDRDKALRGLKFDNPVDEQKGVAVREEFQDLLDVERHSLAPDCMRNAASRS